MLDHQFGKVLLRIMFHALIAERLSLGPGSSTRSPPLAVTLAGATHGGHCCRRCLRPGTPWHTYSRCKREIDVEPWVSDLRLISLGGFLQLQQLIGFHF